MMEADCCSPLSSSSKCSVRRTVPRIEIKSASRPYIKTRSTFVTEAPGVHAYKSATSLAYDDVIRLGDSGIPGALQDMLCDSPDSLVYRAIAGEKVDIPSEQAATRLYLDVKRYLKKAIEAGLVTESKYLQGVLDSLKQPRDPTPDVDRYQTRLVQAELKLERRQAIVERKRAELEVDRELADMDIERRFQEALTRCEGEWRSGRMVGRFNKPSPDLIALRREARALLLSGRFDEAADLAVIISEREEREATEAAAKMEKGFEEAQLRLRQEFAQIADREQREFAQRERTLEREAEALTRPVEKRVAFFTNVVDRAITRLRQWQRDHPASVQVPVKPARTLKPIVLDAKIRLRLPMLRPNRSSPASRK